MLQIEAVVTNCGFITNSNCAVTLNLKKKRKKKKLYVSVTDILRNIFATTKQEKKIRKSQKNVMKRWTLVCFNCFDYKVVSQRGMKTNILFNSGICASGNV